MPANDRRTELLLTAHGRRRAAARGFSADVLGDLISIADRAVPVGRGCHALSASNAAIAAAREDGMAPEMLDRLRRRVLVVDEDGVVVTALIAFQRRSRHYRCDGRRGAQGTRRRLARQGR